LDLALSGPSFEECPRALADVKSSKLVGVWGCGARGNNTHCILDVVKHK